MIHHPKALILDEPTNGLDPSQTQQMRMLIQDLSQESTVLLSTHIMQEVEAICDRVLIMRDGRIVVDEKLSELKEGGRCWLLSDASLDEVRTALNSHATVSKIEERYLLAPQNGAELSIPTLVKALVQAEVAVQSIEPERDFEALFVRSAG